MYSAFWWGIVLLARMSCARICPYKPVDCCQPIRPAGIQARRCDCSFVLAVSMQNVWQSSPQLGWSLRENQASLEQERAQLVSDPNRHRATSGGEQGGVSWRATFRREARATPERSVHRGVSE